jgi:hypothetical protein
MEGTFTRSPEEGAFSPALLLQVVNGCAGAGLRRVIPIQAAPRDGTHPVIPTEAERSDAERRNLAAKAGHLVAPAAVRMAGAEISRLPPPGGGVRSK